MRRQPIAALLLILIAAIVPTAHPARGSTDLQLCVEPQDGAAPLVSFIRAATRTLDGEVYLASSKDVLQALEDAAGRHVAVRINLEQHPYGTGSAAPALVYRSLAAHGVQVRWTSRSFTYTHAKYLVRDAGVAWIGTMNWTTSAFTKNREFGLVDTNPTAVREAEGVFAADWAHTAYGGPSDALVLSPTNSRPTFAALIVGARRTLDLYAEEVNDTGITRALIAAAGRGVRVRMVIAGGGTIAELRRAGVQILVLQSPYIHAKAIVADARVAFVGSENISSTSLDHNREMGLVVRDSGIIATLERTFAADLGGAVPAPAPDTGGTPQAQASPTPAAAGPSNGALAVRASVSPNPMPYNSDATLTADTAPGATCTASVTYSTGSHPSSFDGAAKVAGGGTVSWGWHQKTSGTGGTAAVTCTLAGAKVTAAVTFVVAH